MSNPAAQFQGLVVSELLEQELLVQELPMFVLGCGGSKAVWVVAVVGSLHLVR